MGNDGEASRENAVMKAFHADAKPRNLANARAESWEDDFEQLVEEPDSEPSDEPPSSSALLFAKLTKPRIDDRAEKSVSVLAGGQQQQKSDPLQLILQRNSTLLEKDIDSFGVKRKTCELSSLVGAAASGSLTAPPYSSEVRHFNTASEVVAQESRKLLGKVLPIGDVVEEPLPSESNRVNRVPIQTLSPHIVLETSFSSGSDPNADLSFEESEAGSEEKGSPAAVLRGASKAASKLASAAASKHSSNKIAKFATKASINSLISAPSSDLTPETSRLQELAFKWADSSISFAVIFLALLTDQIFFCIGLITLLNGSNAGAWSSIHIIEDGVVGALFFCEVNLRLFSYGPRYYFHSVFRQLDYFVCIINAVMVFLSIVFLPKTTWLHIVRYIRLIRTLTVTVLRRERRVKAKALLELEELAVMLEDERSEGNRLTKWRIDSDAIAMGNAAGSGGFGAVYLGLFRGTLVAIKQLYHNNDKATEYIPIEEEAVTLVNLRHPNVVLFMGFVHEPDKLWIVTEYCSRGSLRDFLDGETLHLTASRVLKFALGAARGLAYLHGQDPPVLHLDLKTANILISSGWDSKLADFGLSRNVDNIQNNTFAGTIQYSAPEILESNTFSVKADVYSLGVCLWEMAALNVPYEGTSPMEVLWGVVKEGLRPPIDLITGSEAKAGFQSDVIATENSLGPSEKSFALGEKDASARIEAAVIAATGSVMKAKISQLRLSFPKATPGMKSEVQCTDLDQSGPKRNSNMSGKDVPLVPTKDSSSDHFDEIASPVTTAAFSPSPRSSCTPQCISPRSSGSSNRSSASTSRSDFATDSARLARALSPTGLSRLSCRSLLPRKSSNAGDFEQSVAVDIESQLPLPDLQSKSSNKRSKGAHRMANGTSSPQNLEPSPTRDLDKPTKETNGKVVAQNTLGLPPQPSCETKGLDALTRKVTQKMKALDDRPQVAKALYGTSAFTSAPVASNQILPKIKQELDAFVSRNSPRTGRNNRDSNISRGSRSKEIKEGRTSAGMTGEIQVPVDEEIDEKTEKVQQSTFQERLTSFQGMAPIKGTPALPVVEEKRTNVEIAAQSELFGRKEWPITPKSERGPVMMPARYIKLIEQCWSENPEDRPTADDIVWQLVSMIDDQIRSEHQ